MGLQLSVLHQYRLRLPNSQIKIEIIKEQKTRRGEKRLSVKSTVHAPQKGHDTLVLGSGKGKEEMPQKRDDTGPANPERDGKGESPAWLYCPSQDQSQGHLTTAGNEPRAEAFPVPPFVRMGTRGLTRDFKRYPGERPCGWIPGAAAAWTRESFLKKFYYMFDLNPYCHAGICCSSEEP